MSSAAISLEAPRFRLCCSYSGHEKQTAAGQAASSLQRLPVVAMVRRKRTAGVAGENGRAGDRHSRTLLLVRAFPIHPREAPRTRSPAPFRDGALRRALPFRECFLPSLLRLNLSPKYPCWFWPQDRGKYKAVFHSLFITLRNQPPLHDVGIPSPSGFEACI